MLLGLPGLVRLWVTFLQKHLKLRHEQTIAWGLHIVAGYRDTDFLHVVPVFRVPSSCRLCQKHDMVKTALLSCPQSLCIPGHQSIHFKVVRAITQWCRFGQALYSVRTSPWLTESSSSSIRKMEVCHTVPAWVDPASPATPTHLMVSSLLECLTSVP